MMADRLGVSRDGTAWTSARRRVVVGDEVDLLADPAVRAAPVIGYLRPWRPGRETLARLARRLVVDVAADFAPKATHRHIPSTVTALHMVTALQWSRRFNEH